MNVPLLDLKAQYQQIKHEIEPVLLRVAESQYFILGPDVTELEKSIATYVGTKHAIGVSSGTDALLLAMMALGIGPGDGVIVPNFSFFATAGVVARLNAMPIFVEVNRSSYNIEPLAIMQAYEKYKDTVNIKAIVPVHLFGQSADMDPIMEFANAHGLAVIEDAAQAIGTQYKDGRRVGSIGTVGCFSFFPSKNLGAFGDGGIITTNDDELAKRMELMRVHGAEKRYYHEMIGGNFRLDAIQAAVLNVKLPYLDAWHEARRRNAAYYNEKFKAEGLVDDGSVILPTSFYEHEIKGSSSPLNPLTPLHFPHIYNQYCIRVNDRDGLMEHLSANGIGNAVYYPVPFHEQKCFEGGPSCADSFPVSDEICKTIVALPVYPELTTEMMDTVARFVITYCTHGN
ncbi:MAG: DegT/DnrJ/EryC1/StrS family aminotransferase [Desulfofustis sp.]|nr:DegT/DnrJ/EryC1/StrS family aminotransferase [Desulfofustis sp.]